MVVRNFVAKFLSKSISNTFHFWNRAARSFPLVAPVISLHAAAWTGVGALPSVEVGGMIIARPASCLACRFCCLLAL